MPVYVYLSDDGQKFEVLQSHHEPALTHHPETNEPIKRIIATVAGIKTGRAKRGLIVNKKSQAATACTCSGQASNGHHSHHPH